MIFLKKTPIFYSALLLTGVNLLLRLVSTTFQVYISRKIGAAGIGLLQLVLSVGMLAMTAGMAGVRTATMYLTAEELGHKRPGNVRWVLSGCFRYSLLFSGAVAIALYIFSGWIAREWIGDERTIGALRILAVSIPISCLCGVMTGYFTAANRIGTLAAVEVGEQFISIGLTLCILHFWARTDPARACQGVVMGSLSGGLFTLITLVILRMKEHSKVAPAIPVRKRLLRAALPLALGDNLKAGINTTENLMVPKRIALCSRISSPLAAFGMVTGMVFPIMMFPAAILFALSELLIPELARCHAAGSNNRIQYLVKRTLRIAMFYGCLCCGIGYLCAQAICTRLYGNSEAGYLLQRFILFVPMLYCDAVTDAMTKGLGQQTACVRYNIFTSALDVILLYLLLPKYGLEGYFLSFLITHFINFLLSLRRLLKITKINISAYIPMLTCALLFFAIWAARVLPYPWISVMSFFLIFTSSLSLFHILNRQDLYWIWNLIKKPATK